MSAPGRAEPSARPLPRLHAITNDAVIGREGWEAVASRVLEAGGPDVAVHLRGRGTPPRTLLALATSLAVHARRSGAAIFVNDRVDVALVTDVDGVHLGRGSLSPGVARALVGPEMWIGVSRHGPDETVAAAAEGADYVFLGTIHDTASHPGVAALGLRALEQAVRRSSRVPIFGIGGIGPEDASAVTQTGAYGVAAIRGIWDAADPEAAVKRYLLGLGNQQSS